jgi:tRNA 2-thiouridine synthesizing protein A
VPYTIQYSDFAMKFSLAKKQDSIMVSMEDTDQALDITSDVCPMTFVRTRLALDKMAPGQILVVRLRGTEPALNVPRSAIEQGHKVLSTVADPDGSVVLQLQRGDRR